MKRFLFRALLVCLVLSAAVTAYNVIVWCPLLFGNRSYNHAEYADALRAYSEAPKRHPDSEIIKYNSGTAFYKLQDYKKAMEAFESALNTENHSLKASAAFNIGNCLYRQGEQAEKQDIGTATRFYRAAMESYAKAIELNREESDARLNKELTEKKLKALLVLPQQQKSPGKSDKSGQGRDNEDKEQNSRRETENSDTQQARNAAISRKIAQMKEKFGDRKLLRQGKTKATAMSREEAELLLEYHNKREDSGGVLKDKANNGRYADVVKDW
ncbi:MAG: tetratricopeptide repeat protein [Nitrospirales bacterium]|nr:tetratricopeptide repeat protein [Nitrospirales bacterium]